MSDYIIPFEIQEEIMKRLPVKSLIQFRSVSKPWKSLIDSSEFIANYHQTQTQHRLLVSYADPQDNFNRKYVSIVDDDTFPQHKFPLTVPDSIKQLHKPTLANKTPIILDSSQGLFCFYNIISMPNDPITNVAVIWNPTIRKSVDVLVPNAPDAVPYMTVVGFGVCPRTNDPKLVKITFFCHHFSDDVGHDIPWDVKVITLSSGVWRSPVCVDLPRNTIELKEDDSVVIDGAIYWYAYDKCMMDGSPHSYGLIMSFDLITEEFTEVNLPDSLSLAWYEEGLSMSFYYGLSISKLRDSLVVLRSSYEHGRFYNCGVWMMENGDPKSFTRIFTISPPGGFVRMVLGFRKSGETIIEVIEKEHDALSVYERRSGFPNDTNCIEFSGKEHTFFASCYMETLLLLDHQGRSI